MSDHLPLADEGPTDPTQTQVKGRKNAFAFVMFTVLLDVISLGIIIPVWPSLIIGFTGSAANAGWWVGISGTTWAVAQFFCQPIVGALSDKYGRRPVILVSNLGTGIDYFFMALSPTIWFLLVGRLISGITSATFGTAFAYVADVTSPAKRAGVFGIFGAIFGLGFIIGPGLGGLIGDIHSQVAIPGTDWVLHGGPRMPFYLAGALSLVNFCYGWFVLPESLPKVRRDRFRWSRANPVGSLQLLRSHADLLPLALVNFLAQLSHFALQTVFTLYAAAQYHWQPRQIGFAMMAIGACGAIVQGGLTGPVVKLLGERLTIAIALIFGAIGFAIYALAPSWQIFMIGVPVMSLWGLAGAATQSLMTRRVAVTEQGKLQGANMGIMSIAAMIGPAMYGSIYALFNSDLKAFGLPGAPFLVASTLLLLAMLVSLWAAKGAGQREAVAAAE
jgi:DHA1 family tetracycline resistance protein-like MFS transporter